MKVKIGIDPGIGGGIAVLGGGAPVAFDMPVMPLSKTKHQVNAAELVRIIRPLAMNHPGMVAYLERASVRPAKPSGDERAQGVVSQGNFMMGYGVIQGVLAALGVPMVLVTPVVWKRRAGLLKKDKAESRTLAQQLFPTVPLPLKKDIGRAEALLIAHYSGQ